MNPDKLYVAILLLPEDKQITLLNEVLQNMQESSRKELLSNWCSSCGGTAPCWCNLYTPS